VIIEAHRIGAWKALTGGHSVETVADCVTETQTGYQRRRREQQMDRAELLASMVGVHEVGEHDLAALAVKFPDIFFLDEGERSLWVHALTRNDDWILCGPDKASLRFGVRSGFQDRLVALEDLLEMVGYPGHKIRTLRTPYTSGEHRRTIGGFAISDMSHRSGRRFTAPSHARKLLPPRSASAVNSPMFSRPSKPRSATRITHWMGNRLGTVRTISRTVFVSATLPGWTICIGGNPSAVSPTSRHGLPSLGREPAARGGEIRCCTSLGNGG